MQLISESSSLLLRTLPWYNSHMTDQSYIRNFAIIAHIDHGKSTLADRMLEMTGTIQKRDMQEQFLDSNPIERERGITIKLAPVRMMFSSHVSGHMSHVAIEDGNKKHVTGNMTENKQYILNLIDTPGHVDFSYEVSRSLAACEGAILLVDATQGVQAQTLAHLHEARIHNLCIIPVINKIDMPNARIKETLDELKNLAFSESDVIQISAKTGLGVDGLLHAIVTRIPAPSGSIDQPLRALIFSSHYDTHKGVVVFVRIVDGSIPFDGAFKNNQKLRFMASDTEIIPIEIGYFSPKMIAATNLQTGEVGYIATGLKDARLAKVGDTITIATSNMQQATGQNISHVSYHMSHVLPLPGYKEPKSMVFLGLFPIDADELTTSREAMERLRLSDAAFSFRPIASLALGNGFHCGFLGLLHAEIVQERLQREFGLSMIATAPSVEYRIHLKNPQHLTHNSQLIIQSAAEFPDPSFIEEIREPVMRLTVYTPKRYVGAVMQLVQEKRGEYIDLHYLADQAEFTYLIPLSEMIVDFFDQLKSVTEGFASIDYELFDYQPVKLTKVDILVNKEKVDALSFLAVEEQAQRRGSYITDRLAQSIPRQQFEVPIQAAIGGKVIARADVKAFRKDVTKKLYGGDRTRKDKLLDKQKKGKAKMKRVGNVEIPQEAFFAVLKRSS